MIPALLVPALVLALSSARAPALALQDGEGMAAPARSPRRVALLVGCDEYPKLREAQPERYEAEIRLRGPSHDVALVAQSLERHLGVQPENIRTLAGWGADESTRPTGRNIERTFEALVDSLREGDFAFLYFSGHGAQVRSSKESGELDGLDEVFLPADVRAAASSGGRLPGALTDDEIGRFVDGIVERGATAWLIFDTCHSGTMLRGGDEGVKLRGLDSDLLGLEAPERAPNVRHRRGRRDGALPPGVVGFYGAQSFGRAPEMALPRNVDGANTHGLFTYLLVRELERTRGDGSFRSLMERIVSAYQAFPYHGTVPMADGDVDRTILGGEASAPPWLALREPGGELKLNRGRFDGVRPGVELELTPVGGGSGLRARVVKATLFDARLELGVAPDSTEERHDAYVAEVRAWPSESFLRPVALVDGAGRSLALEDLPERERRQFARLGGQLEFGGAQPETTVERVATGPDGPHTYHLLPRPGTGLPAHLDLTLSELVARLRSLSVIDNLRRVFDGPWVDDARDLDVVVSRRSGARDRGRRLAPGERLSPGDEIRIDLKKSVPGIFDVEVFYVDAQGEDVRLFPAAGQSPRIAADVTGEIPLVKWTKILDDPIGPEGVFLVATPREANDPVIERRELVPGTSRMRGAGESTPDPLGDLLDAAAGRGATRGSSVGAARPKRGKKTLGRFVGWETNWPGIAAPAWPRRGVVELEAAEGEGQRVQGRFDVREPAGRAALVRSGGARGATRDLLLLGGERVEEVRFDFDGSHEHGADVGALCRGEAFGAEIVVRFLPDRTVALYDSDGDGTLDLALEDRDGDGMAETRARRGPEDEAFGEDVRSGLLVPLLSQSYLHRRYRTDPEARLRGTGRLSALRPSRGTGSR